jgi:hypothetical protein
LVTRAWPLLLLGACQQAPAPAVAPVQAPVLAKPAAPVVPVMPTDVNEQGKGYEIGISYAPALAQHPELIPLVTAYVNDVLAGFRKTLASDDRAGDNPSPYALSLQVAVEQASPQVLAVSADGDEYTGGAHGMPLLQRWLWLPERHAVLGSDDLLSSPEAWARLTAHVRDQLLTRATAQLDADDAAQAVRDQDNAATTDADHLAARASALSDAARWIDEGTAEGPKRFRLFEPIAGNAGQLGGLRFVFPPYQVGPYSDGVQTVEVPASVLLPLLKAEWQPLFEGGPGSRPPAVAPAQAPPTAAPAATVNSPGA